MGLTFTVSKNNRLFISKLCKKLDIALRWKEPNKLGYDVAEIETEAVCQRMGVSTKQWLCGCEAPEGRPNLSQRFSYEPREGTNHCHNCHREWPMDFHKNYR